MPLHRCTARQIPNASATTACGWALAPTPELRLCTCAHGGRFRAGEWHLNAWCVKCLWRTRSMVRGEISAATNTFHNQFRLNQPWPELREYALSFKLDELDDVTHHHVPYGGRPAVWCWALGFMCSAEPEGGCAAAIGSGSCLSGAGSHDSTGRSGVRPGALGWPRGN